MATGSGSGTEAASSETILVATAAATNANSFVTLASANSYIANNIHIYSTWASLSIADRENSLIYATSLLDSEINWVGVKGSSTQALRWPRDSVVDPDDYNVDSDSIPLFLQKATSYYAWFLSQSDLTAMPDTYGFKQLEAGSLNMVIDKYDRKPVIPNIVWDLIKPYGSRVQSAIRVLERR